MRVWLPVLVLSMSWSSASLAKAPDTSQCLDAGEGAQRLRDEGKYSAARKLLVTCTAAPCPAIVRKDCVTWLEEIDKATPTVVFAARDARGNDIADAKVSLDGVILQEHPDGSARPVDPGARSFVFEWRGRTIERRVVLAAGEKNRLVAVQFDAEPRAAQLDVREPESRGLPVLPLVLAGTGLLALGSFTYFGLTGKAKEKDLEGASCATTRTCTDDDLSSVRTHYFVADVSLVVGIVSLGAAAIVALVSPRAAGQR